jgi:alkylation response protein AidB-like acyl-CoA dehydrogenase
MRSALITHHQARSHPQDPARVLRAQDRPRSRAIDYSDANLPDGLLHEMAGLGGFGATIPEEFGSAAVPGEELIYANIAV